MNIFIFSQKELFGQKYHDLIDLTMKYDLFLVLLKHDLKNFLNCLIFLHLKEILTYCSLLFNTIHQENFLKKAYNRIKFHKTSYLMTFINYNTIYPSFENKVLNSNIMETYKREYLLNYLKSSHLGLKFV